MEASEKPSQTAVFLDALPVPAVLLRRSPPGGHQIVAEQANVLALELLGSSSEELSHTVAQLTLAEEDMKIGEWLVAAEHAGDDRKTRTGIFEDARGVLLEGAVRGTAHRPGTEQFVMTLRRASAESIYSQEKFLASLPEANPNIVLIVGCPNAIEYVNPTGRRWLEEHNASNSDELRHLFPEELLESVCDACSGTGREWSTEYDGRSYDVKVTPLAAQQRCMIAINDVTDFHELAREHELFAQALQSAKTAMLITDPQGNIEFVNNHFEQLYGYSRSEVAGKRPSILNPGRAVYHELGYSDEDYDTLFRTMWRDITDPSKGFWEGELPNRAKDGRIVWVRLLVHAVRDGSEKPESYLGFPVDISQSRFRERQVRMEIFQAITELAELRDNETGLHIQRVGRIARMLAAELGQSRRFREDILSFAPLHDIGKVGIPDELLLAPRRLTDNEFEIMKRHAELGYELLKKKPTMEMAAEIAHGHHERWDGTGYPQGVSGESIPISARIVSVCDVYDALRSARPYKAAWNHDAARQAIVAGRGTQFDPAVVDAFLAVEDEIVRIEEQLRDPKIA